MTTSSRLFSRLPYLVIILITVAAGLPFFLLSYYNHPFLDDYFNAANVRTTGLWGQQIDLYLKWTGRFSTSFLVTALNPIVYDWYDGFRLTPALSLAATLGTVYLSLRTLSQRKLPRGQAALAAGVFLLFYLHMIPDTYSAIYWFTGSMVYHVAGLVLLLVFVASEQARQATRSGIRLIWQLVAISCAIVAGAANEMTLLHLLLGLAMVLAVNYYYRQWAQVRWWSGLLLLTLVVAVITVIAPGNYVRMQFEGYSKEPSSGNLLRQMLAAVPGTPKAMVKLLLWQANILNLLLPMLLWVPVALYWQRRGWLGSSVRLPWYWGAFFMIGSFGLSMFLCIGVMKQMPPDRVVNGLMLFLLPAGMLVVWAALAYHERSISWQPPTWLSPWVAVAYLGVFCCVGKPRRAWQELLLSAPAYDQQLLAREEQMRAAWSKGIEHLVIKPLIGVKPYGVLITPWEITTDPYHYVNYETALFFDVKTIVVDKGLVPLADPEFQYL